MADWSVKDPYGKDNHFSSLVATEPDEPDNIAERGTPAWRDAFNKRRQWKAEMLLKAGALDPQRASDYLADFTARTATERGDDLTKKIQQNRNQSAEIAQMARDIQKQANERQWWAGGSGGRLLNEDEMDQIVSGGYGSATGGRATPETIARWQQGLKGQGMGKGLVPEPEGQIGSYDNYSNPQSGGWGSFYNMPQSSSMGAPSANPAPLASPTPNPVLTPSATIGGGGMGSSQGGMVRKRLRRLPNSGYGGAAKVGGMGSGLGTPSPTNGSMPQ